MLNLQSTPGVQRRSQSLGLDEKREPKDAEVSSAGQKRRCTLVQYKLSALFLYPICLGSAVFQIPELF